MRQPRRRPGPVHPDPCRRSTQQSGTAATPESGNASPTESVTLKLSWAPLVSPPVNTVIWRRSCMHSIRADVHVPAREPMHTAQHSHAQPWQGIVVWPQSTINSTCKTVVTNKAVNIAAHAPLGRADQAETVWKAPRRATSRQQDAPPRVAAPSRHRHPMQARLQTGHAYVACATPPSNTRRREEQVSALPEQAPHPPSPAPTVATPVAQLPPASSQCNTCATS